MAKYSRIQPATPRTALQTTTVETVTFEGAPAYTEDARTELFTLAVTSLMSEQTFYETAGGRDSRLSSLVEQLTLTDPVFIQRLVPYLRNVANMRSAPVVIAAEYALAGGPGKRQVINSAMARADEPAEFLGYWIMRTGSKTLPGGVQRGLADAVARLYTEYGVLKYDSSYGGFRMGDVIELVHPGKGNSSLYQWILDRRHHGDFRGQLSDLPMIQARNELIEMPEDRRREFIRDGKWAEASKSAGLTWEFLSGWLPGGMDAEAWQSVIPSMGYMALLRNLRNFDEAGIDKSSKDYVKRVLTDPEAVAKSRQFPFRFWSAYNAAKSVTWSESLEEALDLSTKNIPLLDDTTLVLVDVSASMSSLSYSARGSVLPSDAAALFGAAMFAKNYGNTRVAVFGSSSKDVTPGVRGSMLRNMEVFRENNGVGHGTELAKAASAQYKGEKRIVIFTDMQTRDGGVSGKAKFTHYFDLGGYGTAPDPVGKNGTFMYGGFTDSTFRQMALHELTGRSSWDDILG